MGAFRYLREYWRFTRLDAKRREIVFYSEGSSYWVHLEPLVRDLIEVHGQRVSYVSSEDDDPGVSLDHPLLTRFVVGEGSARTLFFSTLNADVLVMSMPDLGKYWLRRSVRPVHYAYVHHSLVSMHMIYRPAAFDEFDSILCAGPHHIEETRATEREYGLSPKRLVEHGYGRLDALLRSAVASAPTSRADGPLRVLVAPSWGEHALLETVGEPLIQTLLDAGYELTLRPHPQTRRLNPTLIGSILDRFAAHPRFALDEDMRSMEALQSSDVMISDWSGVAYEYAFAFERPVLFVDVPRKVQNPDYPRLDVEPIEVLLREEVGAVIPPGEIADISTFINRLTEDPMAFADRIRDSRARWVFNVGASAKHGGQALIDILRERRSAHE